ncbi:MAG: Tc toxin subunit A, partial [Gemmatimonadaceae bacterium]
MDKRQLLDLEKNAHLSVAELGRAQPELAKPLEVRLEALAVREALTRMPTVSEKLRNVATKIRVPLSANPERTRFRDQTLMSLREAVASDRVLAADPEIKKELDDLAKEAVAAGDDDTLADTLRLDDPLAFHPEFRRDIDAARIYRFGDAVGLADPISEVLIKEVGSVSDINDIRLNTLIKERKLAEPEARRVGAAATLFNVLDERPELLKAVNASVQNPRDLVKKGPAEWKKTIAESKVQPPPGLSADAYAEGLAKKVRLLFPTDALANRLAQVQVEAEDPVRLANRYVGMRLPDAKNPDDVVRRVGLVNRFLAENPDVLDTDLTVGSEEVKALKFDAAASDAEKSMVLSTARAYQRALTVTDDIDDAEAIVAGGFPSAISLAMSRPQKIAQQTGLKEEIAAAYQTKAKEIAVSITAHTGTLIDVVNGGFVNTAVGNISPAILGYLKELPGFASFFGNQNYCNCMHCRSILGPAAYFVDLMNFVDDGVTQPYFGGQPNHALNLKKRRPDLWTLELTCENTNKDIPYLVIINEVLENTVAAAAGFAGNFADRAAVATKVYRDTLPDRVDSFAQPLHLAFEELVALWSLVPQEAVLRTVPDKPGSAGDNGGTSIPHPASPLA